MSANLLEVGVCCVARFHQGQFVVKKKAYNVAVLTQSPKCHFAVSQRGPGDVSVYMI